MGMTMDQIKKEIQQLARSQGSWGRLQAEIEDAEANCPEDYEKLKQTLEYEEFADPLELVLFFEEGTHSKRYHEKRAAEGYSKYELAVSYTKKKLEHLEFEAKTAEEAEKLAKDLIKEREGVIDDFTVVRCTKN